MILFVGLFMVFLLISSVILFISLFLGEQLVEDREKISPFECGFDPLKKTRIPFSLRFFLVTIIFLVFDVEISLVLPLGLVKMSSDYYFVMVCGLGLILVLVAGLIHEWNQGALNWIC